MSLKRNIDSLLKKKLDPVAYLIFKTKERLTTDKEILRQKKEDKDKEKTTKLIGSVTDRVILALRSIREQPVSVDMIPLERGLSNLLLAVNKQKPVDNKDLVKEIKKLGKDIKKIEVGGVEFPDSISVDNFPPTRTPQPVTHININSLIGLVRSTSTKVLTTATPVPGDVLDYRRSLVFYNNDADKTLYIGGEDVSIAHGTPVPPQSYSPSFDSGPKQLWWGLSGTGSIDVRCIEVSDESAGR